jgi:hypothetical protein
MYDYTSIIKSNNQRTVSFFSVRSCTDMMANETLEQFKGDAHPLQLHNQTLLTHAADIIGNFVNHNMRLVTENMQVPGEEI